MIMPYICYTIDKDVCICMVETEDEQSKKDPQIEGGNVAVIL